MKKENFIIEREQPDQSSCSQTTNLEAISYQYSMLSDGMHGWVFDDVLWGQSRMGALWESEAEAGHWAASTLPDHRDAAAASNMEDTLMHTTYTTLSWG